MNRKRKKKNTEVVYDLADEIRIDLKESLLQVSGSH